MEEEIGEGEAGIVRFLDALAERIVDDFVVGSVASVREELASVLPLVLTVYVILWGYRMLSGLGAPRALVAELMKLSAVLILVLNYEAYNSLVKEPVYRLPDDLAAILVGREAGAGVVELVDQVLTEGFRVGAAYWSEGGILGGRIGLFLIAIMIWISVAVPAALAAFLIVLSKLYLGVLLAVGPAVILLTLFDRTRGIFDRWLAEVLTKALTVAFAILVPRILLHHFHTNLAAMSAAFEDGPNTVSTLIVILFFSMAQVLFYWQVPGLASALGGGLQLAPHGVDRRIHQEVLSAPLALREAAGEVRDYARRVESDRLAGAPGAAPTRWGPRSRRPW